MTYVKIEDGIVTKSIENRTNRFVFTYHKVFKTFSTWIRVDLLDTIPEIGWKYNPNTGFSES